MTQFMDFVPIDGTDIRTEKAPNVVASYDKNWKLLQFHNDPRMAMCMYIRVDGPAYTFQDMAGNPGRSSINEEFLRQYTAQATHADTKFRRGQPHSGNARTFWDENPFADFARHRAAGRLDPGDLAAFLRELDALDARRRRRQ